MTLLSSLIFEQTDFLPPLWSALLAGFATVGWDGRVWLTQAGEEYLEQLT